MSKIWTSAHLSYTTCTRRGFHWTKIIFAATVFVLLIFITSSYSRYSRPNPQIATGQHNATTTALDSLKSGKNSSPKSKFSPSVSERFLERNIRCRLVCSETRTPEFIYGHIVIYRPARLSFCLVHKAASTVWNRFMMLLHNKNNSSTQVLSINKWDVNHNYALNLQLLDGGGVTSATKMTKILTARNPYTRLWSAYVDKFHFPMFFDIGRKIIEKYRPNATAREITCGHNVTFHEFIKFVIGERNSRGPLSSHWLPVSEICGPCQLKPDFIVKQETLGQDIKAILEHVGLSDDYIGDFFTNKKEETTLADELDVHFRGFFNVNNCMSKTQYLRKIWQGLLFNGYLQPKKELGDLFEKLTFNLTVILDTVRDLRKRYVVDKRMSKYMRHMSMVKAYEQISTQEMTELQKLYEVDFKMFNNNSDTFTISNANQRKHEYISDATD